MECVAGMMGQMIAQGVASGEFEAPDLQLASLCVNKRRTLTPTGFQHWSHVMKIPVMVQGIRQCWPGSTFGADRGANRAPINKNLAQPTVELAGPLPLTIQNYTQFTPGIVSGSTKTDAAKALVTFLSSPPSQAVLKAKGFE
jgi:hypothetical protein